MKTTKSKQCRRCKATKPLHEFYPHPRMGDGHLNFCKQCKRTEAENRRLEKMKDPEWTAAESERQRKKAASRRSMFPEKNAANMAVIGMASSRSEHLHHWSYRDEHHRDVIPMKASDHRLVHCYMKYDQERMMYRTVPHMVLLDTREKHEAYCKSVILNFSKSE